MVRLVARTAHINERKRWSKTLSGDCAIRWTTSARHGPRLMISSSPFGKRAEGLTGRQRAARVAWRATVSRPPGPTGPRTFLYTGETCGCEAGTPRLPAAAIDWRGPGSSAHSAEPQS